MLRSRSDGCRCLLMGSQHTVPQKAGKSLLKPGERNWFQSAVQSAGGVYRGHTVALNHYWRNLRIRVKAKGGCFGPLAGKCSKDVMLHVCALLEFASFRKPESLIYSNWRFSGAHGPFFAQAI